MTENQLPVFPGHRSRRRMLRDGMLALTALAARGGWARTPGLLIDAPAAAPMPANYTGLSYETAQLADPEFFSASNTQLVSLFRQLSPSGVLRIGGNSSEFCWWQTETGQQPPGAPATRTNSANYMPHHYTAIRPSAVDALAGFLRATGWSAIYGLNLGTGTPARAAAEAAFVARVLGSRLDYFQIGNEPEFYRDPNNGLRGPGWNFDTYLAQWLAFAHSVLARVPLARFGGPDVGSNTSWVVRFTREATRALPGRIVAATSHYYAEGPPDSPATTVARLLAPDPHVLTSIPQMVAAAREAGCVYRMTEGNTCYRGGNPGMSNAFCSALWAADYMLTLATLGAAGVNLHGGSTSVIRMALGGHLPGATLSPLAARQAAQGSYYTPIAGSRSAGFAARPVYYGMCAAQALAGSRLRRVTLGIPPARATAYAGDLPDGRTRLVVLNKDALQPLTLPVRVRAGAMLYRLTGPELGAIEGVRLGDQRMEPGHAWQPQQERIANHAGVVELRLPAASGAVVTFAERLPG